MNETILTEMAIKTPQTNDMIALIAERKVVFLSFVVMYLARVFYVVPKNRRQWEWMGLFVVCPHSCPHVLNPHILICRRHANTADARKYQVCD